MVNAHTLRRQHSGFLLLEVLVGIAVFVLFVSAIGYTLLYGQESSIMSGDRMQAVHLNQQALEAARAIRDGSFSSVTGGNHGVWLDKTTKKWAFTGAQITSSGGFVTRLAVSSLASGWVQLTAETKWKRGYNRSGSVITIGEMTDWNVVRNTGNWSSPSLDGSYTDGGTPVFNRVHVYSGSYAFLTSAASNGLHIIDVRNTASPSRVNSSFSLGVAAYDAVTMGSVLYVATANSTQEIRAYNIASPTTFSSAQLIGSYNLPGSGRARALAVSNGVLYVGTTASSSSGEDEFYSLHVTSTGAITLLDSVNDDSNTVSMIALSGTAAYLGSSLDSSELRVIDIESPSDIQLLGGYNLSDRTLDTTAVAVFGTSAILGSAKGTIQEAVLFDLESGGIPAPPPGPWYHEGSGSVVGIAMDPVRCYAFLAAQSGRKAFQVFNMRDKTSLAELATYTSTTGLGRGLAYELFRDRVYVITDRSLLIFRPATATGTCP